MLDVTGNRTPNVERYDLAGRLGKFTRTPSGGLRIPAFISRTGVQVYLDAEGREVREYRPATEVFDETSYSSFEGAPVTRLHPPELVNPTTWREHAIGTVQNVRPDGNRLAAELVIEDADAIAEIETGDLVETSAGYLAQVAPLGGTHEGESYDATQQGIRGNHVALGPEGWGRAGPSVRLRIDAARQIIATPSERVERSDSTMANKVKVDGIIYEAGSDSHLQAVEQHMGKLEAERTNAVKRADAAEASLETLKGEHDELKKRADEAGSQEEIDSRVSQRVSLLDRARKVLGDGYKWAGKSDRQIMVDALKKSGHKVDDEATDSWVSGAFSVALAKDSKGGSKKSAGDADDAGMGGGGDDEEETGDGARGDSVDGFAVAPVKRRDGDAPAKPFMPDISNMWRR